MNERLNKSGSMMGTLGWISERMKGWKNESIGEWMNEWMNQEGWLVLLGEYEEWAGYSTLVPEPWSILAWYAQVSYNYFI